MKTQASIVIGSLLLLSASAGADDKVTIGGHVGGHIFSENLELGAFDAVGSDSPRNSIAFGIRAGYQLIERLRLEGELAIMPTETRDSSDDLTVFGWRTHALVDLLPEDRLRPFALIGLGFLTSAPTAPEVLEEDTDLVFHLGAGVEFDMTSNWALRLDARSVLAPSTASDYLTADFEILFGAVKSFPEVVPKTPKDGDKDGVFDEDDKCPDKVEDQDGFQDEDGCPDLDNDGDGVEDDKDQCPAEAESANGIDDDDGCPEPDGDGDGVLGSQDLCPKEAEDKDGDRDEDGCPDEDIVDPNAPDATTPGAEPGSETGEPGAEAGEAGADAASSPAPEPTAPGPASPR